MTISAQLMSAVVMVLSGIFVGCVIDCARTIIHALPKKLWLLKIKPVLEIMVWIFLGFCTFYFLYLIKGGQWRAVDPIFQLVGIASYEIFFARFFRFIGRVFIFICIKPIVLIVHFLFSIVRLLFRFCMNTIKFLLTPFIKLYDVISRMHFKKQ